MTIQRRIWWVVSLVLGVICLAIGVAAVYTAPTREADGSVPWLPTLFWLLPVGTIVLVRGLTRPIVGHCGAWLLGVGAYIGPGLFLAILGELANPEWVAYRGLTSTIMSVAVQALVWPWWLRLLASN